MSADNIPSLVLRECATNLSPAVEQIFYHVTKIFIFLFFGRHRILRPYIKLDH